MPTDSAAKTGKSKGVRGIRRLHSHSQDRPAIMSRYDSDTEAMLPAGARGRLYDLFAQIEKEFEALYAENIALRDQVDILSERVETCSTAEKTPSEAHDATDSGAKPKRSASQISQKIKTTYKASTSKIVSSFRTASSAYSLIQNFRGHRDGVWEVGVSRPGVKIIGTASADHTAKLWCTETGICLLNYLGHQGSVNAIRFNPSSDLVVTTSGDQTAHIWKAQVNLPSHDLIKSHSSGEDDVEGSEKEDMADDLGDQVTELTTLRVPMLELTGHMGVVMSADWMTGGDQVITASWDRLAILHDAETGEQISNLTGHDQELTDVRTHPSQRLVVTSSKDTTFRLWDFRERNMLVSVFQGHTQPVTTAVFAGAEKVVSGSDDRTVKIWDLKNMRSPIATIRSDSAINRLSVSPTQNTIAIPHDNRHIRLYDISGNRIGRLPRNSRQGHTKMVCSVAWDEENPVCNLFSCGFDRQVLGWHINLQPKE
ncbi:hypothetical protein ScPMuIL_012700 [Solemya velum]